MEAPQDFQQKVLRRLQSILERSADRSAESRIRISWVWFHWLKLIDPIMTTGKLPCADFISQVKAHWFVQNRMWQPLVVQVRRLPSLRKGDSLKVGQTTPFSSKIIGKPFIHWGTLAHDASLLPPIIKGESRESSGSDFGSFD